MEKKLISPAELAEMLGVPVRSIYRWNSVGTGPPVLHVGKHARYRVSDVDAWLEKRTDRASAA